MLCVGFFLTRKRWSASENDGAEGAVVSGDGSGQVAALDAFKMGRVQLGALAFFVYSGVELGAGHWAYSILVQSRGVSASGAGLVVTAYWASIFIGRVLAGFVVERVGGVRLVRFATALAAIGAVLFATSALPDFVNAVGLVLVGLAIAPIYPGLMSETPRRTEPVSWRMRSVSRSAQRRRECSRCPRSGGVIAERIGLEGTAAFIAACAALLLLLHELLTRLPTRLRALRSPRPQVRPLRAHAPFARTLTPALAAVHAVACVLPSQPQTGLYSLVQISGRLVQTPPLSVSPQLLLYAQ